MRWMRNKKSRLLIFVLLAINIIINNLLIESNTEYCSMEIKNRPFLHWVKGGILNETHAC